MRILHVTHQYPPAIGGAEKHIAEIGEELARRGHTVDVFTTRSTDYLTWANTLPRRERINGVDVRRFDSLRRTPAMWALMNAAFGRYWATGRRRDEFPIFLGSGPVCPEMFLAILTEAGRYDVIHINHLHYSHAAIAFVAARIRRRPIVLTPHLHAEQRSTWDIGYLKQVLAGSHAVVAQTAAERDHITARKMSANVLVGGVGLSPAAYPPQDTSAARARLGLPRGAFIVLALGRKTEYKGLDTTLAAFRRLRGHDADAMLLAWGPETAFSEALWRQAGGLEGVDRRGAVSENDKLDALAACDVMCMPSSGEAFGITYLEAWAYTKPVIGARIASVSSLVTDGADGFLIAPGDVDALTGRLLSLAADPALRQRFGERGRRKWLDRYTPARVADIVEGACRMALRRSAA